MHSEPDYSHGVPDVELNRAQKTAIKRMMEAVVTRDEAAVSEMLAYRAFPESVYAAPASDFWMWADDYADKRLDLSMPPGGVEDLSDPPQPATASRAAVTTPMEKSLRMGAAY